MKSLHQIYDLSGKTAIVTGGSMGIGYATVRRLQEAGANVVIADVAAEGKKKADQLSKKKGPEVVFIKTDVSSEKDVTQLVQKVIKQFKSIDILVNNAGIFPNKPTLEMTLSLWEKIQAVNLRGVFLCSRAVGKHMKNQGGTIINVASIDALHPSMVGLAAYDASKHGVWGFTKNLALELAPHAVRVNAIAPGGIATEGVANMNSGPKNKQQRDAVNQFMQMIPLHRFGEPDEMALVIHFLASDASSYMTGSMVVADGGFLLT